MIVQVKFYKVSKRTNSTQLPAGAGVELECIATQPFTVLEPGLELRTLTDPSSYNYCYIPSLNRYYWVFGWTYNKGNWSCRCGFDPLASWRDDILDMTMYVTRCSSQYNAYIPDATYPITDRLECTTVDLADIWQEQNQGCYILAVNSDSPHSRGSATYYALTAAQLKDFVSYLCQDPEQWLDIDPDEVSVNLQKALVNPLEYVISVKWCPLQISAFQPEDASEIRFGFYSYTPGYTVKRLVSLGVSITSGAVSLPDHPQKAYRGVWLRDSPYSSYILHFPPFGDFPFPANKLLERTPMQVSYRIDIDVTTGNAILRLYDSQLGYKAGELAKVETQIFVDIQLAKTMIDVSSDMGLAYVAAKAGQGALNQGYSLEQAVNEAPYIPVLSDTLSAIGNIAGTFSNQINNNTNINSILSTMGAAFSRTSTTGSTGSFAQYALKAPYIECTFAYVADDDSSNRGRPLCLMSKLSDLTEGYASVYVECRSGDVNLDCAVEERAAILNFLYTGFYLE